VIVPKYRKKVLYGRLRGEVGKIIRQLCRQKDVELIEGHAMPDHIHLVLSVPPKYSIAMVLGYLKGKSAIHIHRAIHGIKQGFTGRHFWSRGYCVSTIGLDEEMIRAYISDYTSRSGSTYLKGPLKISSGSLRVDGAKVK
jgi:putative transposase